MIIWKAHHGIMKMDAQADYEVVFNHCIEMELPTYFPKGKSWQKIEDATAAMLKNIKDPASIFKLHRGVAYYQSLIKQPTNKG